MPWIIAGGAVIGGLLASQASGDAADAQSGAAREASRLQYEQYLQNRKDLAPWREMGAESLYTLGDYLGISRSNPQMAKPDPSNYYRSVEVGRNQNYNLGSDSSSGWLNSPHARGPQFTPITERQFDSERYQRDMNLWQQSQQAPRQGSGLLLQDFTGKDLQNEPGYQFGLREGVNALDQSAVSRGGLFSGKAMRDINMFGQDYAGTKFNDAFNRDAANKQRKYNFLAGMSGLGQNTAQQTASLGSNYASNAGNYLLQGANAQAAGAIGQANAWNNVLGTVGNAYLTNQYMNRAYPQTTPRTTQTGNVFFP